jgi:c-di-GMP-binding flagellar brake protein YcgR
MSEGKIVTERRAHIRTSKSFLITYSIIVSAPEIDNAITRPRKEKRTAKSFNLSIGGIGFIADENFSPEQVIKITFELQGKEQPIKTYAEVRWSKQDNKISKYKTGIEFMVLKEEDKNLIEMLIK